MKTIWKYEIEIKETQSILMPEGAEILSVQVQNGIPFIWVLHDTENVKEYYNFIIYGTGHEISDDTNEMLHVGTFQLGIYVWHLFESI